MKLRRVVCFVAWETRRNDSHFDMHIFQSGGSTTKHNMIRVDFPDFFTQKRSVFCKDSFPLISGKSGFIEQWVTPFRVMKLPGLFLTKKNMGKIRFNLNSMFLQIGCKNHQLGYICCFLLFILWPAVLRINGCTKYPCLSNRYLYIGITGDATFCQAAGTKR